LKNGQIIANELMTAHEKINYVELPAKDIELAKSFFRSAFGWCFVDYGNEYAAWITKMHH